MPQFPKPLVPGATIGVIAPSSAAGRNPVKKGIAYLEQQGYRVVVAPNLTRGKYYLAGDDSLRLHWLECFLQDREIDGIIAVRGGYGLLRIIDKIDFRKLEGKAPKVIIGYSDLTALQLALLKKLDWISYSGPMLAADMGQDFSGFSEQWLWKVIKEHPYPLVLKNPPNEKMIVYRHGTASGPLIGACLSLLAPLLGTDYMPVLDGAILVLEDIGEKTYRLDRLFQTLKLHGVFEKISGLILGHFVKCFPKNPAWSFMLPDLLDDLIGAYRFPVIMNFAYGHITHRLTLPIGAPVQMTTTPPKVTILKPV